MPAVSKKYQILIDRFPLRPLKSDTDLDKALELSIELHQKFETLTGAEIDYLDILTDVIEKYEDKHHRVDTSSVEPHETLQFLMEQHGLTQSDLKILLGVSQGRASELMNGIRGLTKDQLTILSIKFNVSPSLFLPKIREQVPIVCESAATYQTATQTIKQAIQQAIKEAVKADKTYVFSCNGLMMTINRNSKLEELMQRYQKFIKDNPDKPFSATFSLFE